MRYVILFFMMLTGCGDGFVATSPVDPPPVEREFEGVYYFENGGYLGLSFSHDGDVIFESANQSLTSVNPENGTLGVHPKITGQYEIHNDEVRFIKNVNYSNSNDIEEDVSGSNITGSRRTDFVLQLTEVGLRLTITIYGGPINDDVDHVDATRVFESI